MVGRCIAMYAMLGLNDLLFITMFCQIQVYYVICMLFGCKPTYAMLG